MTHFDAAALRYEEKQQQCRHLLAVRQSCGHNLHDSDAAYTHFFFLKKRCFKVTVGGTNTQSSVCAGSAYVPTQISERENASVKHESPGLNKHVNKTHNSIR